MGPTAQGQLRYRCEKIDDSESIDHHYCPHYVIRKEKVAKGYLPDAPEHIREQEFEFNEQEEPCYT